MKAVVLALIAVALIAPPARADEVVHDHASQRYDRAVSLLRDEVRRHTSEPVDLVTWTEVQGRDRSAPLHRRGDGWATRSDPRTDVAISWRLDRFRLRASAVRLLTRRTYLTTNGFPRRTRMIVAVLDDRDGSRVLVTVAHMPSSVQWGAAFKATSPTRVAVWKAAVDGWARQVRDLRRRWHPDLVLTVADWNVDVRLPVWRRYLLDHFRASRLTWTRPLPKRGTHAHGRLIDATLTNARGRARLLPHTSASDHTAYRERLSFSTP